jgi:hypothetical protein
MDSWRGLLFSETDTSFLPENPFGIIGPHGWKGMIPIPRFFLTKIPPFVRYFCNFPERKD